MTSDDDLLDRLLLDVDPDAPETDLDEAVIDFLLRIVTRKHATSADASTAETSIDSEAA